MKQIKIITFIFTFLGNLYSQGSVLLVGGGTENYGDWSDQPYKWLVDHAPNRKILVLHYSDTTTWFSGYFPSLSPCKVTNRFINSTAQANDSSIYHLILQHDGIFLRGGDQAQYVSKWKNSLTQQAIKEVYQRGGVVGGTSAGEMILSNISYTSGNSDNGSILRNPTSSITLLDDFLPLVKNILAESHSNERGRIGRLPVFLARYKNSSGREITGVAVDANTALAVGADGVGEVMGGSAVSFLRWSSQTKYLIEPGKSFSMNNMKLDQLLPGYKINLTTGEIILPSSKTAFIPNQISLPKGMIILDGSGNPVDWSAPSGCLKKLQSILSNSTDIIGIFSSFMSSTLANTVNSTLNSWGASSRLLFIDEVHKNDPVLSGGIDSCGAFIFVGNSLDSVSRFLDPTTSIGNSFSKKVNEGKPILFLSEDVMLSGEKVIGGIYFNQYSAYYGTLTQIPGLNLLKGMQIIPRLYQNQNNTISYDYSENRIMGMYWSMSKSQLPYGMLIDAGTYIVFSDNKMEVLGLSMTSTPIILIDARDAKWVDSPLFHRPGKPNAVQNAALIGAYLHIIRAGDINVITTVLQNQLQVSGGFFLDQNYPNPFNPLTKIRFSTTGPGKATLRIYNLLGQEVAILFNQNVDIGVYETQWDASKNASGIYFARLDLQVNGSILSQTNKIMLTK